MDYLQWELITGDAACTVEIASNHQIPPVDYVITSPPYWDMLHARGAATQKVRRTSPKNWMCSIPTTLMTWEIFVITSNSLIVWRVFTTGYAGPYYVRGLT